MAHNDTVDHVSHVLSSYAGRDKALRTLAFYLQLKSTTDPEKGKEVLGLAKQLSAARLVMRQFNHPGMIKACRHMYEQLASGRVGKSIDTVEFAAGAAVTGIYTVYGVVELVAWLSDAKLLPYNSALLYRYCLYLWLSALIAGIIRQLKVISSKGIKHLREDLITLTGLLCDFISGCNSLPPGMPLSGKLTLRQSASLSLIASVIGFYKLW